MPILSTKPMRVFNGRIERDRRTYTVRWQVVATQDVSLATVLADPSLPQLFSVFFGFNYLDTAANCIGIAPNFAPKSKDNKFIWQIDYDFEAKPGQEPENPAEEPRDGFGNPVPPNQIETAEPVIRIGWRSIDQSVTRGTFKGFQKSDGTAASINNPNMPTNTKLPITNSSLVPLLPPLSDAEWFPAFFIQQYKRKFYDKTTNPAGETPRLAGKINASFFNLRVKSNGQTLVDVDFPQHYGFCAGQEWTPFRTDNDAYFLVETEIWLGNQPWYNVELDRGLSARALALDPDGFGGIISPGNVQVGQPPARRMVDISGNPIDEPVALNGNGQPCPNPATQAVYLAWQIKGEINFTLFGTPFYVNPF